MRKKLFLLQWSSKATTDVINLLGVITLDYIEFGPDFIELC